MSVITPVGGLLGPRPTGAAFRTGVWKQPEVYQRRIDGVWVTPTYPDLAPYATNSSGQILVGTYNPGKKTQVSSTQETRDYVRPKQKYPDGGACLDSSRWAYLYTQAVTNNLNWRFEIRYYDEPTGANVFGKTPQTGNVKRVAAGNSCYNMNDYRMDYEPSGNVDSINTRYMWHDEFTGCATIGTDYNLLGTYDSTFTYTTTTVGGPSSTRWPFGAATQERYDNIGNTQYTDRSAVNRAVSIWLLPP